MTQYDNYGRDQNNLGRVEGNVTFNQTQIIQLPAAEIKTHPFNPTSPYRGLKPFAQTDKDYFFGRDQCLTGLVNELEQTNVILLLGASGSGKSSVVRAGLIPWLKQKWGSRLIDLILTPDHDPFESLYISLGAHHKQSEAQMVRAGNVNTLSQIVQNLKRPETFCLIFVDQLEELFTTSLPEKRDRFIRSLVQLSQERSHDPSLKIVLTMRSDFLDKLDLDPANLLAKITHGHRPLITQMHRDELRLAIEQPAARHGVVLEADLVETIVNDVQGQAGYLPLLQYTLNRLWEEELQGGEMQQERTLHTRTYLRLGGVRGALQQHVDEIYAGFEQAGTHLATQRIFLKLVEIGGDAESGTDWKPVRRRANRSEFKDEQEKAVLAQLIDQMLVVSDRDLPAPDQESTVEIAHEILLTSWTTLDGWIKDNRRAISLRNRLNVDVASWQTKQADDELWAGAKLARVLELRNDSTFNDVLGGFSPIANQFIDASAGRRDREAQAELEQERKSRGQAEARAKAERRGKIIAIWAMFSSTILTTLVLLFGLQANERKRSALDALVSTPQSLLETNSQLETSLASFKSLIEVMKIEGNNAPIPSVFGEVIGKVYERNRLEGHQDSVTSVTSNLEESIFASSSEDGTIKVWNRTGILQRTLRGHTKSVWNVRFSPSGKKLASASLDGTVGMWVSTQESPLWRHNSSSGRVYDVSFSPNGKILASCSEYGIVQLWDVESGKALKPPKDFKKKQKIVKIIFSSNGEDVAFIYSNDPKVRIWNIKTDNLITIGSNDASPSDIKFKPNAKNRTLAVSDYSGTIELWDVDKKKKTNSFKSDHDGGRIYSISFSPAGNLLASSGWDKTIRIWAMDGSPLHIISGNSTAYQVSFMSNETLVSANFDKTVRVWKLNSEEEIKKLSRLEQLLHYQCKSLDDFLSNSSSELSKRNKQILNFCKDKDLTKKMS